MNKNFDLVLFLFGTFSLFTEHGNTRAYSFSHTRKCDNAWGCTHALCPLAHRHLMQRLLSSQRSSHTVILADSDPRRQPVILTGSDPRLLSRYLSLVATFGELCSLAATFGELHSQAPVFWYCLHLCGPRALSQFKFTQQSTSLLSCLVGKNICRVSLFEWVILFKKPTVIVLIGNYIDRVKVKGSLYFRVYGMVRQTF